MPNIQSVLQEKRKFEPPAEFAAGANIPSHAAYEELIKEAEADWEGFWSRHARDLIDWIKPFSKVFDSAHPPFYKWFHDGELNASANCLDRHLEKHGDKTAIIFESDEGETTKITYRDLHARVCRFANALRSYGVKRGDRVVIYMPMRPEAIIAMQASARLGAIHSVVFGGFSAKSLEDRIKDAQVTHVITSDESRRGGKTIPLKRTVDEALASGYEGVKHVVVLHRAGAVNTPMTSGRDIWWEDAVADQPDECSPEPMNAEDPLFILYTSGSTGKPKGIQHSTGGYLLGAIMTMQSVFDYHQEDIFWCTADVGWITGHSYVCYGPLAVGATQVIFEGVPTHPHVGRFWEIIQKHRVTTFYTAPTAIRSLIKMGGDKPGEYDLSSLRLLGTVGEPINPEAWMWYFETIGKKRCPIVDTWWQTETGSIMISPLPGAIVTKPGSCTVPLPGVFADVVDESGREVEQGRGGFLVIKKPWPSRLRTIWGDAERFLETYYPQTIAGGKYYVAGDSAHRDEDGYFWIMGRIDDVLNVSGHRLGTMEVESALVAHSRVAEAAVVGRPDEVTGETIVAFVVLKGLRPEGEKAKELAQTLRSWVAKEIGPIARPKDIRFGDNLPKTRSGKIMRRLLRAVAREEKINQDTSTLENPAILDQLRQSQ